MKLANLKIGTRLGMNAGFLMVLVTLVAGAGIWLLGQLGEATDYMVDDAMFKERLVNEWHHATELNGVRTMMLVRSGKINSLASVERDIKATSAHISELQKQLDALIQSGTGKALYADTGKKRAAYLAARNEVFRVAAAGEPEAASTLAGSSLEPALQDYLASIGKLAEHQKEKVTAIAAQVASQDTTGQYVLGALLLLALAVGLVSTARTALSITRPLLRAIGVAQTVARGDLTTGIEIHTQDETGQLLAALNEMTHSLVRIVDEVRTSTGVIATASSEIATGNLDLSARTEQQAASLEETASSMEELTSAVKQNAEHARQASTLAVSAQLVATKGGQVVSQVVGTMGSINDSARKIVDIIGVIDGIAFQTNILALNAAVEAARAGEQGRGFAVVAAEVRNLAQRSAGAAKEIKTLINDSVDKVDAGSRLVDQAGSTMGEIVASIGRVTEIVSEISMASREQEAGIEQINNAITSMDAVTQQNAALVEQAAAASASLQERADTLAQVVSVFRIAPPRPLVAIAGPSHGTPAYAGAIERWLPRAAFVQN
jgi:methyl-accepting chemotaxis protein